MLAKCVSMAPPWGKFWFILFMSSVKQLKARASRERAQERPPAPPLPKEPAVSESNTADKSCFERHYTY